MAVIDESEELEVQIARARERLRERVRSFYRVVRAGSGRGATGSAVEGRVRAELARRALAADLRGLRAAIDRASALDELRDRLRRDADAARAGSPPVAAAPAVLPAALPTPATGEMPAAPLPEFTVAERTGVLVVHGETPAAFPALRGSLPLPVRGSPSLQVRRREGGQVELGVGSASIAQAVAPGRVAFAGDYAGLGKLVIVDHGGRWHTVTAGLVTLSVGRGSDVRAGDSLGVASGQVLFEVRQGSRTLDGVAWLGLR
jgi:septal ring factor EnvC (AmiA/AmiB activator)